MNVSEVAFTVPLSGSDLGSQWQKPCGWGAGAGVQARDVGAMGTRRGRGQLQRLGVS